MSSCCGGCFTLLCFTLLLLYTLYLLTINTVQRNYNLSSSWTEPTWQLDATKIPEILAYLELALLSNRTNFTSDGSCPDEFAAVTLSLQYLGAGGVVLSEQPCEI